MGDYQSITAEQRPAFFKNLLDSGLWGHDLLCLLNAPNAQTMPLIHMREQLLQCIKKDTSLAPMDTDFKAFFEVLFNRSLLTCKRIIWGETPQTTLQKLMDYEAIHQMNQLDDLKRRLIHPDRLMYAFFHPLLGDEPLIFTEVALMQGNPTLAHAILADGRPILDPNDADTATFYGISKSHLGLSGIPFGNLLLKAVVQTVKSEFNHIDNFVTLSPITGLTDWAGAQLDNPHSVLNDKELETVQALLVTQDKNIEQQQSQTLIQQHAEPLRHIITKHITQLNKWGSINRVAHFHLGNGAEFNDIQILADVGRMHQSYGCMVNYRYRLQTVEDNIVHYHSENHIALSDTISSLVQ